MERPHRYDPGSERLVHIPNVCTQRARYIVRSRGYSKRRRDRMVRTRLLDAGSHQPSTV